MSLKRLASRSKLILSLLLPRPRKPVRTLRACSSSSTCGVGFGHIVVSEIEVPNM